MSVRAFLAIELENDLKNKISEVQDDFRKTDANINYVSMENIHLTLKFFGEIDLDGLDKISEKINGVIDNYDPFNIEIGGCGAFPNKEHIRVLHFGIKDNKILNKLHDELDAEFESIGIDKDKKFSTHITFGRMKSKRNKEAVQEKINEYEDYEIGSMDVKKISLIKSTLTPKGPIYELIKEYEFEWLNGLFLYTKRD